VSLGPWGGGFDGPQAHRGVLRFMGRSFKRPQAHDEGPLRVPRSIGVSLGPQAGHFEGP